MYENILHMFDLHEEYEYAVAVVKDGEAMGHVLQTLSKVTSFFLRYNGNFKNCEVQLGVEVFTSTMDVRLT